MDPTDDRAVRADAPVGERLVVAYKFGKAALEALAAILLSVALAAGWVGHAIDAVTAFGQRSVHPAAVHVVAWVAPLATPDRVHVLAMLLGGDAVFSAAEGWVLRRRYRWGRWLVVLATGALLPVELYELARRPSPARAILLVVNATIVVYLARRTGRERPRD